MFCFSSSFSYPVTVKMQYRKQFKYAYCELISALIRLILPSSLEIELCTYWAVLILDRLICVRNPATTLRWQTLANAMPRHRTKAFHKHRRLLPSTFSMLFERLLRLCERNWNNLIIVMSRGRFDVWQMHLNHNYLECNECSCWIPFVNGLHLSAVDWSSLNAHRIFRRRCGRLCPSFEATVMFAKSDWLDFGGTITLAKWYLNIRFHWRRNRSRIDVCNCLFHLQWNRSFSSNSIQTYNNIFSSDVA